MFFILLFSLFHFLLLINANSLELEEVNKCSVENFSNTPITETINCLSDIYCGCNLLFHADIEMYYLCLADCNRAGLLRCPCDFIDSANTMQDVTKCYLEHCSISKNLNPSSVKLISVIFIFIFFLIYIITMCIMVRRNCL